MNQIEYFESINGPARSVDGKAISRNTAVTIIRVVGNLYYVQEIGSGAERTQGQKT